MKQLHATSGMADPSRDNLLSAFVAPTRLGQLEAEGRGGRRYPTLRLRRALEVGQSS
jgi:hypothetical protein